eukprot:2282675-Rhodomonas_salina.2
MVWNDSTPSLLPRSITTNGIDTFPSSSLTVILVRSSMKLGAVASASSLSVSRCASEMSIPPNLVP